MRCPATIRRRWFYGREKWRPRKLRPQSQLRSLTWIRSGRHGWLRLRKRPGQGYLTLRGAKHRTLRGGERDGVGLLRPAGFPRRCLPEEEFEQRFARPAARRQEKAGSNRRSAVNNLQPRTTPAI